MAELAHKALIKIHTHICQLTPGPNRTMYPSSILFRFPTEIEIKCDNLSFTMLGDRSANHGLGRDFPRLQCHEPIVTNSIVDIFKRNPESVFWDIGATYGYYTILANKLLEKPENIHSFEPDSTVRILRENNKRYANGKINIIDEFVGDGDGDITLNEYFRQNRCPDVVKIDVDGEEDNVIEGMKEVIDTCVPSMFIEIHFGDGYERRIRKIDKCFSDEDYEFFISLKHREENEKWKQISSLSHLPSNGEDTEYGDYMLFCEIKR